MKKIEVEFSSISKYEFDEDDPAFGDASDEELEKIAKYMAFTDLFLHTREEDVLPLLKVIIHD